MLAQQPDDLLKKQAAAMRCANYDTSQLSGQKATWRHIAFEQPKPTCHLVSNVYATTRVINGSPAVEDSHEPAMRVRLTSNCSLMITAVLQPEAHNVHY